MEFSSIGDFVRTEHHARMEESPNLEPWEPEKLAKRLIAVRKALGLTKAEFADLIEIDRSSYTKIEKGEKPLLPNYAFRVWQLFAVDLNFLYLGQLGGLPVSLSSKVISFLNHPTA